MEPLTEWLIYGSGLSALVLAERLANAGKKVILVNPGQVWGGIFGGLYIGDDVFDAGMTNFEFDLFGEPDEDLQGYHPDRKRDVGRYVHFVQQYLSRFVRSAPLPTPSMRFGEHVVNDLIISNSFDVLRVLEPQVRGAVHTELQSIVAAPNHLHPRTKNDPLAPMTRTPFDQVSLANHGPTLHHLFIEPMVRKVLGISTAQMESVFHRNAWAPLFYPESLLSQFGSSPQVLKPTVFRYPADLHFGAFIGRIADKVQAMPSVRVIYGARESKIDVVASTLQVGGEVLSFRRLAWGGHLTQLLGLQAQTQKPVQRASLDLFFLKVRQEGVGQRFAVLIDPQADSPFYRVTNQSLCAGTPTSEHKIILECNASRWIDESTNRSALLDAALQRYGIDPAAMASCQRRSFKGALAIPSHAQMHEFNECRAHIKQAFPRVELIGASSGYVSVTLNDHIIQALKIAQQEGVLN